MPVSLVAMPTVTWPDYKPEISDFQSFSPAFAGESFTYT
jgi:hypothetical protein